MNISEEVGRLGRGKPAKTAFSPRSSSLETIREEERLRLSDRNSILVTSNLSKSIQKLSNAFYSDLPFFVFFEMGQVYLVSAQL